MGSSVTTGNQRRGLWKMVSKLAWPYRIDQVMPGNAYMLEELDGVKFPVDVNGQHLKKYFPSMWDNKH
jgi:hypothetical protein